MKPIYDRNAIMNRAREYRRGSGGKSHKWAKPLRETPKKGTWERLVGTIAADWKAGSLDAINSYQRTVWPERFEEFV